MRQTRLLLTALGALLALCGLFAVVADAVSVTELKGTFSGGASSLSALGGKALTGTSLTATFGGCKEAAAGAKDTNLCESTLTFKGVKQGAVACRSESSAGTKDAIETVLVVTDDHLATETNSAKELEGLLLFKVLGQAGGEEELTVNCGGVKDKVRGVIGCLVTPDSTTVPAGGTFTSACKQATTMHDAETGECVQLCEWLKEHPFEANLGAGFEDAWMSGSMSGSMNITAYIDTETPMLLILEGTNVTELKGTFSGGALSLSALGGKALTGTSLTATFGGCKEAAAGAKDTNLCESTLTFKGVKQGAVACRSESSAGTKDAIETVLVVTDDHLATETNSAKELQGLLLFKVLGQAGGEEELTINCGGVKDKVKGVIGCLITPGLATVASTEEFTIACAQNEKTKDAETGTCEQLCEWLTEHPFEANLGAGFEDTWMSVSMSGSMNMAAYIDTEAPMLLILEGKEDPNAPMLLILEGSKVTELEGTFSGGAATLAALGGKAITSTSLTETFGGCKEAAAGAKDTNLCESTLTLKGFKQGAVACRSESSAGTKDAIETILVVTDDHLATETNAAKELQGLLLLKVLGQAGGEEELIINCGGLKEKVRGVLGCLMTPGLKTVAKTEEFTVACKQNEKTRDAETGTCQQLCEWLNEHPFETNLGAGFEDAWMSISAKGALNFSAFIDD